MLLYEDIAQLQTISDNELLYSVLDRTLAMAVVVGNDIHYMHFLAAGEDFDKSHLLAQEYYERLNDEADYLAELSLEYQTTVVNYNNALSMLDNYEIEDNVVYDYATIINHIIDRLTRYTNSLNELRNTIDDSDVQSKLDDMLRYWNKEIKYKLARRTQV